MLSYSLPVNAVVLSPKSNFSEPVSSGLGGRSLLIEELTATWCPSCAEVDPYLVNVADSHGSRIILTALHPSGVDDAFENDAASQRILRKQITHPEFQSTPMFIVEDGEIHDGYDAWTGVQQDILEKELTRSNVTELSFTLELVNETMIARLEHVDLSNPSGQLTFLLLEHGKEVSEGYVNPGGDTRDRVLVGLAECSMENDSLIDVLGVEAHNNNRCDTSFAMHFEPMVSFSVILLHEPTIIELENGTMPKTYGAIEMSIRERSEPATSSSMFLLIGFVTVGISLIVVQFFRNSSQIEEKRK